MPVTTYSEKKELVKVVMPVAIAESLYAVASKDEVRKSLHNSVFVERVEGKVRLVATDTHTLLIASPADTAVLAGLEDGLYHHQTAPIKEGRSAVLFLEKSDLLFVNYQRVVPEVNDLTPCGMYDSSDGFRLEVHGDFAIDLRKLQVLVTCRYDIQKKVLSYKGKGEEYGGTYVLDAENDGWHLRYVIMGMQYDWKWKEKYQGETKEAVA